ncbi:MAG: hypothetical protein ABIF40_05870 [archaeon]
MAWFSSNTRESGGPNYMLTMFLCLILGLGSMLLAIVYFLAQVGGPGVEMLPSYLFNILVVEIMLAITGMYLFITAFQMRTRSWSYDLGAIVLGLILFLVGLIPLAVEFRLMSFLPFNLTINGSGMVFSALLFMFGIFLLMRLRAIYTVWVMYGYY